MNPNHRSYLLSAVLIAVAACSSATGAGDDDGTGGGGGGGAIVGRDVQTPYPIDRGSEGGDSPGTYKGLPLRLTDNGKPAVSAVSGVIGMVCIGMSNANQECADFQARFRGQFAPAVNPAVRFANCAVGGHAIELWIDPSYDAELWTRCINQVLPAAGIRPDQVRVIFHKAADQFTSGPGNSMLPVYPAPGSDYENFRANLQSFAARVKAKFPSAQAVYTSSRSYGGYANSFTRGEPLSYEEGHALNTWLATHKTVDGVWYGWGPYLWAPACGTGLMNKGGVCYDRADYVTDGVHPSASGEAKVSALMHARFLAEDWYKR
ncbi:MAG TPA: hypothetical protein VHM24_09900 [Gemmatimonadaceae bacterium]|nr:hypothetical protein [Gemmatimonadaceae bacterium]